MTRVDRASSTPFLLRVFSKHGEFHDLREFDRDPLPVSEHHVHAWKDMTLGQLTDLLVKDLIVEDIDAMSSYRLSYRLIYSDTSRSRYETRSLGNVQVSNKSLDHDKSLGTAQFVIGDWLDVAILKPGDRLYDADPLKSSRHSRARQPSYRGRGASSSAWRSNDGTHSREGGFTRPYERQRRTSRGRYDDKSDFRDRPRQSDRDRW